jgi:hypothetical protein
MNADWIVLYYFGALCGLFLVIAPLIMLARIMADVRKIRQHHDRLYHSRQ